MPTILLSYHTTSGYNIGETPFNLTYDIEAVIPIEIASRSLRLTEFDVNTNEVELHQDLDIHNEKRKFSNSDKRPTKPALKITIVDMY